MAPERTLTEVIDWYQGRGYTASFQSLTDSRLRCLECRREMHAQEVRLDALYRLEGTSDPSEEVAVAAMVCPHCGAKATMALTYGPEGTAEDALVLRALDDHRLDTDLGPMPS